MASDEPFEATAACAFRVTGKLPEFWSPQTGRIEPAAVYEQKDGVTGVSLTLEPRGSTFVVFRHQAPGADPVTLVRRDGKTLLTAAMQPRPDIVVRQARYGVLDDPQRTRDVTKRVQQQVDAGSYDFPVATMAEGDDPAFGVIKTLVVDYTVDGKPLTVKACDPDTIYLGREVANVQIEKAVYGVLDDPNRTRDVREKLQRLVDAGYGSFTVSLMARGGDPAYRVVKTLDVEYTMGGKRLRLTGTDPDTVSFFVAAAPPRAVAQVLYDGEGRVVLEAREPGLYELTTASGSSQSVKIETLSPTVEIDGPWEVAFDPKWGGPEQVTFDQLVDWSKRSEDGIRFYSGAAVYRKTFAYPESELSGKTRRVVLDLGKVAVMAEVQLNGKQLGILWKPPFRVDVTDVLKSGDNSLEVKVVNLWINRMIGDEQLPDDSQRNPNGTLPQWPQWVQEGKPSPTGRYTFTSWRLWKKDDPLAESGLLGPVTLQASERVNVE